MNCDRRRFIAGGLKAAAAAAMAGPLLTGCGSPTVKRPRPPESLAGLPQSWMAGVLHHAAMAPSGHNSQPWQVIIESSTRWTVRVDPARTLPAVDPEGRESLLGVGAFLETLTIASASAGRPADITVQETQAMDPQLTAVTFGQDVPRDYPLQRIRWRRTLKSGQLPGEIRSAEVAALKKACDGNLHYFPRGSRHAVCIAEGTVEAFRHQSARDDAQKELARWVRFTSEAVARHGDGLTLAGMEVGTVAGLYMRHFMTPADVTGEGFRQAGVDKTAGQVGQGGGWMIITSPGHSVADIVDAGRRFQRLALMAREYSIAIHPMTQMLEEPRWREEITRLHGPGMVPQFILRVGYVDRYPDPVSPRRPVSAFTRIATG